MIKGNKGGKGRGTGNKGKVGGTCKGGWVKGGPTTQVAAADWATPRLFRPQLVPVSLDRRVGGSRMAALEAPIIQG